MAAAHEAVSVKEFRPAPTGVTARVIAALVLTGAVLALPRILDTTQDLWMGLAAIYAIIGLSVNIITGHGGQISLGHQAFVGIGAFMAAYVVKSVGNFPEDPTTGLVIAPPTVATADFWVGLTVAGLTGTAMAVLLGLVALRIRGLYLALITLAFGLMTETTIFNWRAFTGGGAGAATPRPAAFQSNEAYAYVCLGILAVFLFIDWRLVKTRAGRAITAFRNNERVASTLGVNVTLYKLLSFGVAGFLAGVAGGLFGHWNQAVQALDFELRTALVWVLMAVVGGLGSRAGVVIGSAFFAVFPLYLSAVAGGATLNLPGVGEVLIQTLSPFFGALLLLLTITLYPGGIGQQILPFRRWLAGGPLVEDRHEAVRLAGFPLLIGLLVTLGLTNGAGLPRFLAGLAVGAVAAFVFVVLLLVYLRRLHRSLRATPAAATEPAAAEAALPAPAEAAAAAAGAGNPSPAGKRPARRKSAT
ncbi:MAG TPA: branched-chain amino acid ABC transporter permease [Actinomycetota bacterium]|nr:branched-chain amino acid ABC transporter permease [Actinomycetota bacterium]